MCERKTKLKELMKFAFKAHYKTGIFTLKFHFLGTVGGDLRGLGILNILKVFMSELYQAFCRRYIDVHLKAFKSGRINH